MSLIPAALYSNRDFNNAVIFSGIIPLANKNTKKGLGLRTLVVKYACSEKGRRITNVPNLNKKCGDVPDFWIDVLNHVPAQYPRKKPCTECSDIQRRNNRVYVYLRNSRREKRYR